MKHHTTDPAKRAEHIANREERKHERELFLRDEYTLKDWPYFWLETYRKSLEELVAEPLDEHPLYQTENKC